MKLLRIDKDAEDRRAARERKRKRKALKQENSAIRSGIAINKTEGAYSSADKLILARKKREAKARQKEIGKRVRALQKKLEGRR